MWDVHRLRNKVSTCQRLETYCYDNPSRFTCVPAALYCWGMYSPMQATGRNLYDVRKTCNRDEDADGPLCYKELGWIESWLNRSEVKEELGAPKELKFASCDMKINQNFLMVCLSVFLAVSQLLILVLFRRGILSTTRPPSSPRSSRTASEC